MGGAATAQDHTGRQQPPRSALGGGREGIAYPVDRVLGALEIREVDLESGPSKDIEIPVLDVADAKRFYGEAFGWTFNDYGPTYAGIRKDGGGEVGGFREEANIRPGGPLLVLYSTDLDASQQAIKDAGGTIIKDTFSFPGGRRFEFTDPSGNELAVWSE